VTSLAFTPTSVDSGASITVGGNAVASGGTSPSFPVVVGINTFTVTVISADGTATRTYAVIVTRANGSVSADASLSALTISTGTLSPAFAPAITNYAVAVDNSVGVIVVTPIATSGAATITVNAIEVPSGSASNALTLNVGVNILTLVVTAQDGVTMFTYTVAVTRAPASVSSDATLSGLQLSAGSLSPGFSSGTLQYTAEVNNTVVAVGVTATTTNAFASLTLNGVRITSGVASLAMPVAVGGNALTVVVTAQDGSTTVTYTVIVTRDAAQVSTVATLSDLALSVGGLTPAFVAATGSYITTVPNSVAAISVTATTTSSAATLKVNGQAVVSGSASPQIGLVPGSNTLSIVVTAQDGFATQTYTVVVTRSVAGTCVLTATETDGPFPLYVILTNTTIVRSDIRESKTGVPLTLTLTLLDSGANCAALSGAAVSLWQCDKDGLYSGYNTVSNAGQTGLTYLRGIQVSNGAGQVSFTTIFPGWYAGRITHLHVQVYLNDNLTVTATATTQLAFPQAVTTAVYNTALYTKGQNTSVADFADDTVFSDGTATEMVAISGDPVAGYAATLTVVIA
jgi:protocatechuate 3,4-dioxygenase beta subunit